MEIRSSALSDFDTLSLSVQRLRILNLEFRSEADDEELSAEDEDETRAQRYPAELTDVLIGARYQRREELPETLLQPSDIRFAGEQAVRSRISIYA